jgi:hypothetical protein
MPEPVIIVDFELGDWEAFPFALVTSERLTEDQAMALYPHLEAWAWVAIEGGFGG